MNRWILRALRIIPKRKLPPDPPVGSPAWRAMVMTIDPEWLARYDRGVKRAREMMAWSLEETARFNRDFANPLPDLLARMESKNCVLPGEIFVINDQEFYAVRALLRAAPVCMEAPR